MANKLPYKFKSKKGNDVMFRYPRWEDLESALVYANKLIAEDTFIDLSGKPKTLSEEKKWLKGVLEQVKNKKKIFIVVEVNGTYAGSGEVRFGEYRHSHTGDIGIALDAAHRNEGIGTELMKIGTEPGDCIHSTVLTQLPSDPGESVEPPVF